MAKFLTYIRHGAAVVAGWIVVTISGVLGMEPDPETTGVIADAISALGIALFGLIYAFGEKTLKPLFKLFGEVQPGEDAPLDKPTRNF